MAPKKSPTISPNSSKPKPANPSSLKQATLGFTSTKRAASTGSLIKSKGSSTKRTRSSAAEPAHPEVIEIGESSSDSHSEREFDIEITDEDEDETNGPVHDVSRARQRTGAGDEPAVKRRRTGAGVFGVRDSAENMEGRAPGRKAKMKEGTEAKSGEEENAASSNNTKLDENDKRWTKHYGVVRERMGWMQPIHGDGQTKIDEILRVFDLSYEYGPCIGSTRLERWKRAEALGLKPPAEVKEILLTKEGREDPRFSECVFYGEV